MLGVSEIINRMLQNIQMMRGVVGVQALQQVGLAGVTAEGIEPVVLQSLTPDVVASFIIHNNAFGYYKPALAGGEMTIRSVPPPV
jgi:hypothetical protein